MPVFVSSVKIAFLALFLLFCTQQQESCAQQFASQNDSLQTEIRVWLGKIFAKDFSDQQASDDASAFMAFLLDRDEDFSQILQEVHRQAIKIRDQSGVSADFYQLRAEIFNTALVERVDQFNEAREHSYHMTSNGIGIGIGLATVTGFAFFWFKKKLKKPVAKPSILKYSLLGVSCGITLGWLGARYIVQEPHPRVADPLKLVEPADVPNQQADRLGP